MIVVSVIVPVYNEEKYLSECIDSLLVQTYKYSEIIFVDDGSIDSSRKIISDYIQKNKKIRLLTQNHGGPGKARNLGTSKSKGRILVFVDGDMVFDKNYIKVLIKPILDGKVIGTSHRYEYTANKENIWARSWSINRIPDNIGKYAGVYRAILKNKFLEYGKFNPEKGYFDDDLSKLGNALIVDAVCRHNNPTTLKEAFKHSVWVGSSFYKNKETLKNYIKTYFSYLVILPLSLILIILLFIFYSLPLIYLLVFTIFSIAIFLESFAIKRIINEKYLPYIYLIPILMSVRFFGYGWGFIKAVLRPHKQV